MTDEIPKPPPPSSRVRRVARFFFRLVNIAAVLICLALLTYLFIFPRVVRKVVSMTLADLGYPGASFVLRSTSLNSVELADIRPAGADETAIRNAVIEFSPLRVFRGELKSIRLVGVDLPVTIRNGVVTFGLAPVADPSQSGPEPAPKPLPFKNLEIASSTLTVNWENRQLKVPVQGTVTPKNDAAAARVDLLAYFQGSTIPITGTLDPNGAAVDLSASGRSLTAAGVRAAVPWTVLNYPIQASGLLDFGLAYQRAAGRNAVRLQLRARNLWITALPPGHRINVERLTGPIDLELTPEGLLTRTSASLTATRISYDDLAATDLKLSAAPKNDAVNFDASFSSDRWKLTNLKGLLTNLANPKSPLTLTGSYEVAGSPPKLITDPLAEQGILLNELGPATLRGTLSFLLPRDDASPWQLRLPDVRLSLAQGAIQLTQQKTRLAGVSGTILLDASVTPDTSTIRIQPGTQLSVASVKSGDISADPIDAASPLLAIELPDQPATFDYKKDWSLHFPNLRLSLRKSNIKGLPNQTNVAGFEGVLNIGGDLSAGSYTMTSTPNSFLAFQSVDAAGAHVGPARFSVNPTDAIPLFHDSTLTTHLQSSTPITVEAPGNTKASAQSLSLVATLHLAESPSLSANIALDHASASQPTWSLENASASIPFTWNTEKPSAPRPFSLPSVTVAGQKLPPITGTLVIHDRQLMLAASSNITKGATLAAKSTIEFTPAGLKGNASFTLPEFTLTNPKTFAQLVPAAASMDLIGTFAIDGNILFNGPLVKPRITATVKDAKLTSAAYDLSAEGINTSITIDSFDPVRTPGQQRLRIPKLHLGKLDMINGGIEFQLERPDSLLIERTRWTWAGGQLYTYALRVNPASPTNISATVYADKLDLRQLLGVVASGEASGEGLLYGRLPVKINWPEISFSEGFLYATGAGGIQVGRKADVVSDMLDQSNPRFSTDPQMKQVKDRILDALKNFGYDTLKVDFTPKDGGLTASVTVRGKGKTGPNPQELDLTLNINGFDQLLKNALVIKNILSSMTTKPQ